MTAISQTIEPNVPDDCLEGGGEMGALMRAYNWTSSPLGPTTQWPQSLKTALSILLASGYPMYVAWGSEFIQFYNDAYRPILGSTKHPRALGQGTPECFAEIWDFIGPMFRRAVSTGLATSLTDQILPLDRNGFTEECYFTFSYSAIRDDDGAFGGVLVTVIETTDRVLSERRVSTLREFATATAEARTTEQACQLIAQIVLQNPYDLPFSLLYLLSEDGASARLLAQSGVEAGDAAAPLEILLDETEVWPLRKVRDTETATLVDDLLERFAPLKGGAWPEPPRSAMILPINQAGSAQLAGFLITGLSARLALDDRYRGYLELLSGSVATVIGNARAYERERRRAETLAELDRAKTTFFSNVSHEFRTPLTLILGQIEEMLSSPERDRLTVDRGALEMAHRNGMRLLKLVNTLLDFSRIEAGRVQASYEPTDIAGFTAELASVFRSAVEAAGMRLLVDCPPLQEPVYVDREMWEKIVLNLLSNAFKFTAAGEIEVRVRALDEVVELSVRDTGTGISADQIPHIFERFHRVEGTRARTHEGTGIGLALVQELVRLHGGSIRVESALGIGSTFTVAIPTGTAHLPAELFQARRERPSTAIGAGAYLSEALSWMPDAAPPASAAPSAPSLRHGAVDGEARRSLIVVADDNSDMRGYLCSLLQPLYDVVEAEDGAQALKAVYETRPDLVLSDVMMPVLDGFELVHTLRSDSSTNALPVILVSARAGEEARVEGMAARADDYLTKPFSARELLARVATHLELASVRRQATEQIHRSEERFRAIFDNAPHGIVLMNLDGEILETNPAFSSITGYAQSEVSHIDFNRLVQENASPLEALLRHEPGSLQCELLLARRDGAGIWSNAAFSVPVDTQGRPTSIVAVFEDVSERKVAERERERLLEELQLERERLNDIFTQSPASISILSGPEHVFERINPPFRQLVGDRNVIGKPLREALPELAEQGFVERLDEVYQTGEPFTSQDVRVLLRSARDSDLAEHFIDFVYLPLFGPDGAVTGILAQGVDLTGRKRVEQALIASKESLNLAVSAAQLGTFYCEIPLNRIVWNNTCKDHFFLPHEAEVDFELFYNCLNPEDQEPTRLAIERCISEGAQYNVEYRTVAPDGRTRWINAIGKTYFKETGEADRFDGITIDITEKKSRERMLEFLVALNDATRDMEAPQDITRTAAMMLAQFLHASRCLYASLDEDGEHVNCFSDYADGCASLQGRHRLADFGRRAVDLFRSGRTEAVDDVELDAGGVEEVELYRTTETRAMISTGLVSGDRVVGFMSVHQTTPRKWTPQEIALVEIVADRSWAIVERARAHQNLKAHAEEIAALNRRLHRSMRETHHRVKNNLQVVAAMIDMQAIEYRAAQSVPLENYLQLKAHVHTLAIVHDLLTRSIKEDEAAQRVPVKMVLERLMPMLQFTALKKQVKFSVEEALLSSKQCIALSLILNELITNAHKHGRQEAQVRFFVRHGLAVLEVADDGPGFPPGWSTAQAANMGLELVESLVRTDLDGYSSYENRPQGGANVTITFPLPEGDA